MAAQDPGNGDTKLERGSCFGFPGQYDASGVDLSLIRENLKLSPEERARRAALRVLEIGREAREARSQSA